MIQPVITLNRNIYAMRLNRLTDCLNPQGENPKHFSEKNNFEKGLFHLMENSPKKDSLIEDSLPA